MKVEGWKTLKNLMALRDWNEDKINPYAAEDKNYNRRLNAIITNVNAKKKIELLNEIISKYLKIYNNLKTPVKNTLVYNKGYFRITVDGKYKYLKMENV